MINTKVKYWLVIIIIVWWIVWAVDITIMNGWCQVLQIFTEDIETSYIWLSPLYYLAATLLFPAISPPGLLSSLALWPSACSDGIISAWAVLLTVTCRKLSGMSRHYKQWGGLGWYRCIHHQAFFSVTSGQYSLLVFSFRLGSVSGSQTHHEVPSPPGICYWSTGQAYCRHYSS